MAVQFRSCTGYTQTPWSPTVPTVECVYIIIRWRAHGVYASLICYCPPTYDRHEYPYGDPLTCMPGCTWPDAAVPE